MAPGPADVLVSAPFDSGTRSFVEDRFCTPIVREQPGQTGRLGFTRGQRDKVLGGDAVEMYQHKDSSNLSASLFELKVNVEHTSSSQGDL